MCVGVLWGVLKCEKMKLNLAAVHQTGTFSLCLRLACVPSARDTPGSLAPNASFCVFTEGLFMFDIEAFAEILSIRFECLYVARVWFS